MAKREFKFDYKPEGDFFIKVPLALFSKEYKNLPAEAKLIYGLFCTYSEYDSLGRSCVEMPVSDISDFFGYGQTKIYNLLNELEEYGLIMRYKRGIGKNNLIYLRGVSDL